MTRDNHTVALSVALEPLDINGLPHSPALLLDGRFGAAVTDHPEFALACEVGFEGYSEMFLEEPPSSGVFSLSAVLFNVSDWTVRALRENARFPQEYRTSLSWVFGFTLGWLSALALSQYQEAQEGLCELQKLFEQEKEVLRG